MIMSLLVFLFLVSLSYGFVSCEKCSESLSEALKKGFDSAEKCEECKVLLPWIRFGGSSWGGFCVRDKFFFFENWKCREEKELKANGPLVVATEGFCEHFEGNIDLDMRCFSQFNAEVCKGKTGLWQGVTFFEIGRTVHDAEAEEQGFLNPADLSGGLMDEEVTAAFSDDGVTAAKPLLRRPSSTRGKPVRTTIEKSTPEASTESTATATENTSEKSTSKSCPTTKETLPTPSISEMPLSSPENPLSPITTLSSSFHNMCEPNEFSFNNHCYFIRGFGEQRSDSDDSLEVTAAEIMKTCQAQHPKALGLAVETKTENAFIFRALRTIHMYDCPVILTSGVKMNGMPAEWFGWNLKINENILNFWKKDLPSSAPYSFYSINTCNKFWYLYSPNASHITDMTFRVVCERPYNPKNTQEELHRRCLELYRKSPCYRLNKHENFCCAKDEHDEIWFACPNNTETKFYPEMHVCNWSCRKDGFFAQDRPICRGGPVCSESYKNVKYVAPINRYAISSCPSPYSGYSSWFCGMDRTFVGTPDYSLCCKSNTSKCKDTDEFLNIWMGCRCKKIVKRTTCPPGAVRNEAVVEWYCQENGTFRGNTPDYSNCYRTDLKCSKTDIFEVEWVALPGTTAKKSCPPSFTGDCFWKCQESGMFEGPEPDCSKCKAGWMDEIADKIKNQSQHEEIMEIMENYTEKEDLRIGFSHVINLTSECVTLYKSQIDKRDKFSAFNKFLKSYSKILRNIAGSTKIWASFSEPCREEYVDQILKTTHNAAFANLEIKNRPNKQHNTTFSSSGDGLDFFVAYNPPVGTNFPLQNHSSSDWHLRIKEINDSTPNFAAMGLVLDYSLSSLMFPRGNETKDMELNAPTVTFTVAAAAETGEVVIDPNVVVTISFKHTNRTRYPTGEVIRRRLHKGEQPSGVFNSTLCFYYRDSEWSTEGCSVTYTSRDRTNCTCNHLSTIGLLMSIHKYQRNKILEFVSSVSSGITIVSLVLALLVFHFVDKGSNDRKLIGKNLCLCLLIGHIMLFSVMDKKFFNTSDAMCRVYAIMLHYVFMAAFSWMFVEGCHLYRMLILVFDSNIDYRWIYMSIGYGVPLVVVGGTQLVGYLFQEQPYGQDELCWLKTPNYVWAFIGPVIVSTSINFCILIVALKLAISSKRRTEKSKFSTLKVWVKGWISLSTLLGITWLFGLGYIHYNESLVYVFIVFNGLQGFFIFLFRCVFCEQYKSVFIKKFKSWFSSSKSTAQEPRGDAKPGTKVFAVSATKSSSDEAGAKDSGYESKTVDGQENERSFLHSVSKRKKPTGQRAKENPPNIITLTPAMSEDYLRNRMISKNFSARKSKASWLGDADNFPELSYHSTSNRIECFLLEGEDRNVNCKNQLGVTQRGQRKQRFGNPRQTINVAVTLAIRQEALKESAKLGARVSDSVFSESEPRNCPETVIFWKKSIKGRL